MLTHKKLRKMMQRSMSVPMSMADMSVPMSMADVSVPMSMAALSKVIPKHELRKIKQRVQKLRSQGHEVFTDEEVEKEGWVLEQTAVPSSSGLHVMKEKQKENWDCGLACVQMVLSTLGDTRPSQPMLAERLEGNSVWTVDLAYLLRDWGVEVEYLTTAASTITAADYKHDAFYAPSILADAHRVNRLLCAARAEGVPVAHRSLSAAELWNLMSEGEVLIIALVDHSACYQRADRSRGSSRAPSRPQSRSSSRAPSRPASRPPSEPASRSRSRQMSRRSADDGVLGTDDCNGTLGTAMTSA